MECQEGRARPLILSEFTGSYSYAGFRSCIAINPWDSKTTAEAIYQVSCVTGYARSNIDEFHQALTMSDEEALSRWKVCELHMQRLCCLPYRVHT